MRPRARSSSQIELLGRSKCSRSPPGVFRTSCCYHFASFKECTNSSDTGEAIQASGEGLDETLESLLKDFNKDNNANLKCGW